jgi:hypothetical protein
MTRKVLTLGAFSVALLLAGCGSDSDSIGGSLTPTPGQGQNLPPITTSPPSGFEGSWQGTINTPLASSRAMEAVILDDGTFWMAYAKDAGEILHAAGIIQGKGSGNNGNFTLTGGTLISLEDNNSRAGIAVSADYVTGSSLNGTVTQIAPNGSISLPSPASFTTLYQLAYNNNLKLVHLAGNYPGQLTTNVGKRGGHLNIRESGEITGGTAGGDCTLTGTAAERTRSNVFNFSITFGSEAACGANAGLTMSGVLSQETNRIAALAMDSGKTHSFVFVGHK